MPTIARPTVTLSYEDSGQGEPALVFLHGWCDSSATWGDTATEFSGGHRCLAPDMRGHGRSGLPLDHAFTPEALCNDVIAICEAARVTRPVLVGHSFGGFLAATVAMRHPGFAHAVVIVDQPLDLRGFAAQMRSLEGVIRSPATHTAFRAELFGSMMTDQMPPDGRALIDRTQQSTPVEVGLALWAPLFEYSPDEIGAISDRLMDALAGQPALLVDGQEPAGYYDTLRLHAADVELRVLGTGHWAHIENPVEFRAILREFLSQLGA
jgi:pimeloyl-ACP methyl ester carboxylesterase